MVQECSKLDTLGFYFTYRPILIFCTLQCQSDHAGTVTGTVFQCIPASFACDEYAHCPEGEDELNCQDSAKGQVNFNHFPPALVDLDDSGFLTTYSHRTSWENDNVECPQTHLECPGHNYCIPVYLRCNGVYDCPEREDETGCDNYTCAGFYRCRGSTVCLHSSHVCDGFPQCPQSDDELLCNLTCPESCTCYGQAFFCTQPFQVHKYPDLRFLEARATGMVPADVTNNTLLVFLDLSECGIAHLELPRLPNLHSLNLNDNLLKYVTVRNLKHAQSLQLLFLAGNPLVPFLAQDSAVNSFPNIRVLDLSRVAMKTLSANSLSILSKLQLLNLSDSGLQRVVGAVLQKLQMLQTLDLRGCPVSEFPPDLFQGLTELQTIYTDNYRLCCPVILPDGFNVRNCHAPSNVISSCESLLLSDIYRVFLSLFAALSLLGNVGSLAGRLIVNKGRKGIGFDVLVSHLSIADLLMGMYLAVIGVADQRYRGNYVLNDMRWKNSGACKFAGFLSLLSSEVSALIICLITADRFLVLRFPLSQLRFSPRSALLACCVVWTLGLTVAAIPLLPVTAHWRFYSQTGICVPLPITRNDFPGHDYSFGILIVTNFVLFLLIAVGQIVIFLSIRASSMRTVDTARSSQDITIARRLITIAVSDFLCWFPIGLLGLLAARGVAVPGEVNVAMAIFALPINSAINPFLYTLNIIQERRRRKKEELILKFLLSQARSGRMDE